MTCRDALTFIAEYLDGNLPIGQRLSFGLHMSLCRHCRTYLENYRKTIQASRDALTDLAPCEDLPEDLVQAILAIQKQGPHVD